MKCLPGQVIPPKGASTSFDSALELSRNSMAVPHAVGSMCDVVSVITKFNTFLVPFQRNRQQRLTGHNRRIILHLLKCCV